jgi:hypothetical protein
MPTAATQATYRSVCCPLPACLLAPVCLPADVKELVPEFYCQPEFMRNADGFDLGAKQVRWPEGRGQCGAAKQRRRWARVCVLALWRLLACCCSLLLA